MNSFSLTLLNHFLFLKFFGSSSQSLLISEAIDALITIANFNVSLFVDGVIATKTGVKQRGKKHY